MSFDSHLNNVIEWLRLSPAPSDKTGPIRRGPKGREIVGSPDDFLPILRKISNNLSAQLRVSSKASDFGGGKHTPKKSGVEIVISPLALWQNTPAICNVTCTSAEKHMNMTLAHELGHAAKNCGNPPIWSCRRKVLYGLIIIPLLFFAVSLILAFVGWTSYKIPYVLLFAPIVGAVIWIIIDPRLNATEEVIAEVVGYSLMCSIAECSNQAGEKKWSDFSYSQIYLLKKINIINRNARLEFLQKISGEVEARLQCLQAAARKQHSAES